MKVGDLVVATRKFPKKFNEHFHQNRYIGIYTKEEYGDKFIHCLDAPTHRFGRFSPDFWDVEIINENW